MAYALGQVRYSCITGSKSTGFAWELIDDVWGLTCPACTPGNAAARGLSLVVPVFNEAAGLPYCTSG